MGRKIIKGNRILFGLPGKSNFVPGCIIIENGFISDFVALNPDMPEGEIIDAGNNYVLPGFIDNHAHAAVGIDASGCTADDMEKLSIFYGSKGVTGFLPTLTTNYKNKLLDSIKILAEYFSKQKNGAHVLGIHMEGPCINKKYRGAQNAQSIVNPRIEDFQEYISESENTLKIVTIAPELPGAMEVIDFLSDKGISLNLGHSDASFKTCLSAFDHGIGCISHFLNGMRLFHQHEPSIMGAVFMSDNIYTEIICDGFHLVPDTVRVLNKILGHEQIILITDSIVAAGWSDGQYETPCFSEPLIVKNGDTRLLYSNSRAGSTVTMDKAFKNFIRFTGLPVEKASRCVSINPARHLGVDNKLGSIELGKCASFTILDTGLNVTHTIVNGKCVYRAL